MDPRVDPPAARWLLHYHGNQLLTTEQAYLQGPGLSAPALFHYHAPQGVIVMGKNKKPAAKAHAESCIGNGSRWSKGGRSIKTIWISDITLKLKRGYEYKFAIFDADSIEFTHFNPPNRTNPSVDTKLVRMGNSIDEDGVLEPIVVASWKGRLSLVEGNGRVFQAQKNGQTEVPGVIIEKDPVELFALLNGLKRGHRGSDFIHAFLMEPDAVYGHMRGRLYEMQRILGRRMMEKTAQVGGSAQTFTYARKVAKFTGKDIKEVFPWVLKQGGKKVRDAIDLHRVSPARLVYAIENKLPPCDC